MRVVLAVAGIAIRGQRDLGDILGHVAGLLAIEIAVSPGQRESRLFVVIKAPRGPIVRIVAERAVRPQAPFMMVVAVAGDAHHRRAFVSSRAMAFLARHDGVAPDQRKSCEVMIEGFYLAPVVLYVTSLAAGAELAFVLVILSVTCHAGRRQLVAIEIASVARIALDLHMGASQRKIWKLRILVMIEVNGLPLVLVMAPFAFGAVPSAVDILNLVAIHAGGSDALVAFADMAGGAHDRTMCALEPELGLVVIERLDARPCGLAMTILAGLPEASLMRIDRLVTIEAAARRVAELDGFQVTAAALHCLVCLPQLKVRKCVIERLAVQLIDVGIAPDVIRMTFDAFLFHGVRLTPMKSLGRRTVRSDFLVTSQAEPGLRPSRERRMAVATLLLEFGMPGDDRPRRDQLLEHILRSNR